MSTAGAVGFVPRCRHAAIRRVRRIYFYEADSSFFRGRKSFVELEDTNPKAALMITRELSNILCSRLRKANSDVITQFDALVGEVEESGGIQH